jgi:hypothetical protein
MNTTYTVWQENNKNHFFKEHSSTTWIETADGQMGPIFKFVSKINDVVILYAQDRNFYVSLDSTSGKFGDTINTINSVFVSGKWIK